jgi:hypothetical protein
MQSKPLVVSDDDVVDVEEVDVVVVDVVVVVVVVLFKHSSTICRRFSVQ